MEGSNRENMQADEHQDSFTSQDHPEESGWTFYLDDDEFFPRTSRDNRVQPSSSSCYDDTPSMISDADSLAPWNKNNKFMDSTTFKKLGLLNPKKKKKKINSGIDDPDMEDTASSPVNSPKVSSMKQYHRQMNSPRRNQDDDDDDDDDIDIEYSTSQQRRKGNMSGDHQHFSELQLQEERNLNRMDFVEMRSSPNNNNQSNSNPRQFTDLKEKGLCVVPLSMLVNYLK
ncbi:hypothetical protein MKX01_022198 [Papaver californicum]|nr:hypothetical protein MKX01_022198 [Papaver californicum]